jgi:hypothetical protein
MPHPRPVTDMQVWMIETGRTDTSLAAELTAKVKEPPYKAMRIPAVSGRTVARWRKGLVLPRYPQHVAILSILSGNRVTANCFVQAPREDQSYEALKKRLEFEKLELDEALHARDVAEIASRLWQQLQGVSGSVAISALAQVTASILGVKTSAGSRETNLFEFQRRLWGELRLNP